MVDVLQPHNLRICAPRAADWLLPCDRPQIFVLRRRQSATPADPAARSNSMLHGENGSPFHRRAVESVTAARSWGLIIVAWPRPHKQLGIFKR